MSDYYFSMQAQARQPSFLKSPRSEDIRPVLDPLICHNTGS
jgi:hypothetical protein